LLTANHLGAESEDDFILDVISWPIAMSEGEHLNSEERAMLKTALSWATALSVFSAPIAMAAPTITYTPNQNSLAAPFGGQETVIQDFSSFASGTVLDPGNIVLSNSVSKVGTKPNVAYTGKFLAVGGVTSNIPFFTGGEYTVSLAKPSPLVSFVLGTLDPYNAVILTYGSGLTSTYAGNAIIGGGPFTGDGRVTFDTGSNNPLLDIKSISFYSSRPAFEIAQIASAAPEPAAWGMMILGFGLVGGVLRSRHRQGNLAFA
jgi:hypothetical protein